jgi:prephenate dehydratase
VRIAFLGPEGTFSEEALMASLDQSPQRVSLEPVPLPTIYDCVMAVEDGTAERAIVPIENSVEGSVNATLDALVFETDEVKIVGEVVHPVRHCLIARR